MKGKKTKTKKKIWPKVLFVICLMLSAGVGFWVARTHVVLGSVNQNTSNALKNVKLPDGTYHSDKKIVNVLVIGNDYRKEKNYDASGLPDSMMIATLDKKHKTLKLTSLMRDQIVQIPGHGENKLNACFGYGEDGVTLLYKTIAQNFNIKLDGYVEFGFKAVTEVVNEVGGIEVELTESEANYLNTTNYIRNKKYRNVKVGKNKLNGAQAMGYSRIRKTVYTPTGLTDDYGRTWRQRNVVNAVFQKVKRMSWSKLMDLAQNILSNYVTTDLSSGDIVNYAKDVVMMGTTDIYQLQIPVEGYYENNHHYTTPAGSYLGDVLLPNLPANAEALNQFIFKYKGSAENEFKYQPSAGTTTTSTTDTTAQ